MAYSTSADVIARSTLLVGITDASTYIAIADGDIDDALRGLYSVPFSTVPSTIARLSADRAAGLKLRQLYRAGNMEAALFADLLKDFDDGIAAIQQGRTLLNATRAGSIDGGRDLAPTHTNQTDDTGEPYDPTFAYGNHAGDGSDVTLLDLL